MLKKGFTLAETMITVAILGLLAAILIPALNKVSPNDNKIMFRKAYYTLERAISFLINDDVNYPSNSTTPSGSIQILRGLNNTDVTSNGTTNKFCFFLTDMLNTVGSVTCPGVGDSGAALDKLASFNSTDGISWKIYFPVSDTSNTGLTPASRLTDTAQFPVNHDLYTTKIIVDVNGDKAPNCTGDKVALNGDASYDATYAPFLSYCATGKNPDTYVIGVRYDGKLQVGYSKVGGTAVSDQNAIDILASPTNNSKY